MKRSFNVFQSIYLKIPLLFMFILLITFQFISIFFINRLEEESTASFKSQINTQAELLIHNVVPILEESHGKERKERLDQSLASFTTSPDHIEVQLINTDEYIIAVNTPSVRSAEGNRVDEPNVKNALVNQRSFDVEEYNADTKQYTYQLIKPIQSTDSARVLGAVLIRADMSEIMKQRDEVLDLFIRSGAVAIIGGLIVSLFLSQGLTRPIDQIRQQAIRISEGIYEYPAEVYGKDELGELTLTVNDLSDKVREAQESTEAESQRLDSVLRYMTDGVIATDSYGNVILVNDRALSFLNVAQENALGFPILKLLDVEDYEVYDLLTSEVKITLNRQEGGIDFILNAEFSAIRRESGFVTGLVCVLTDITEQAQAERERREFVSNVSHELRTPLTSIKNYSEVLANGAWKDEEIAPKFLGVIQSETYRMIRMISNLLDLSKMDGGQMVLDKEFVDFKALANHVIDRFKLAVDSGQVTNIRLNTEFTARDLYVEIDQDRIIQVMDNLINNAIKYSPDGGEILISIGETADKIRFTVKDYGIGVPRKDLDHLFERFYRVDKARNSGEGGTGLGLAISREIIELHGGKIGAISIEGRGSTFYFELPYEVFDDFDDSWGV